MTRTLQLGTGLVLTGLAGYVDALGFIRLSGLYTSFMSGNTTQLAVSGAQAEAQRMVLPALLLLGFLVGSILGSWLAIRVPARWSSAAVLVFEAALMAFALWLGFHSPELGFASFFIALAMGSQNAVLSRVKGFRAGATFVTGALFSFGQKVAQALTRTGDPLGWVGDGLVWLSLLAGAFVGALAYDAYGLYALTAPTGLAAVLALVATVHAIRAGPAAA